MRILTLNICRDGFYGSGVARWEERRDPLVDLIRHVKPDILALQEATIAQLRDLDAGLLPLRRAGVRFTRSDEFHRNALYYHPDTAEVISEGYLILPGHGSLVEGKVVPRTAAWARLRVEGRDVEVVNTHLDPESRADRMAALEEITIKFPAAIIVGDFNEKPRGELYQYVSGRGWEEVWHPVLDIDNPGTYVHQGVRRRSRPDWILLPPPWVAHAWNLEGPSFDGTLVSDHAGVKADVDYDDDTARWMTRFRIRAAIPTDAALFSAPEQQNFFHYSPEAAFAALRRWRSKRAQAEGVPADVIAPDSTLRAIAQQHPRTATELAAVHGIGRQQLAQYRDEILQIMAEV